MITSADPFSSSSPFVGYSYSYPHKTAHRRLAPHVPLAEAWREEQRDALFLYLHVPFCEHRCGFCNLFSLAAADNKTVAAYLGQLRRQATAIRDVLTDARFARIAVGGGTPTFFDVRQLDEMLDIVEHLTGASPHEVPMSCEASPATVTPDKLKLLRDRGVDRLSLGVQSFDDDELRRLGRPPCADQARRAIETVRSLGFPTLNVDLIYGTPDQSLDSWARTLREAVAHRPEEIYLYPLYVRESTGLGKLGTKPGTDRLEAYRLGRRLLLGSGYRQVSQRMFRSTPTAERTGPVYCCQADGMVGIGCGARSYTRRLHYSTEYAVVRPGIRSILGEFLRRDERSFSHAEHGFRLDEEDQRRRFAILGLLLTEGLSLHAYRLHFKTDTLDDLPQLRHLLDRGLARLTGDRLRLTELGIERSDAVGPWLYSERVCRLMETHQCR